MFELFSYNQNITIYYYQEYSDTISVQLFPITEYHQAKMKKLRVEKLAGSIYFQLYELYSHRLMFSNSFVVEIYQRRLYTSSSLRKTL